MEAHKSRTPGRRASSAGVPEAVVNRQAQYNSPEMPAGKLIPSLSGVRETGSGRWLARCPAHDDRSPSLAVRETGDGTLLVHCFAGCDATSVVHAVGLEMQDLFPDHAKAGRAPLRRGERWVPRDVLQAVASEALVALVAAEALQKGQELARVDIERLATAAARLRAAADEVGCG